MPDYPEPDLSVDFNLEDGCARTRTLFIKFTHSRAFVKKGITFVLGDHEGNRVNAKITHLTQDGWVLVKLLGPVTNDES